MRRFRFVRHTATRCLFGAVALACFAGAARADNRFGFDYVAELARKAAAEPFKAPAPVPDFLIQIGYDDYRDIRFDTAQSLWKDGGRFQAHVIHPGLYYQHAVAINVVDAPGIKKSPSSTN